MVSCNAVCDWLMHHLEGNFSTSTKV